MADNFGKWVGGDNWVYAPQWASGRSNDGNGKKKFGDAGMRRRIRFNPNPTSCNHPGCRISQQSKRDKEVYRLSRLA